MFYVAVISAVCELRTILNVLPVRNPERNSILYTYDNHGVYNIHVNTDDDDDDKGRRFSVYQIHAVRRRGKYKTLYIRPYTVGTNSSITQYNVI